MKDSLVRHWAQKAQMALDVIDTRAMARQKSEVEVLATAIDEVRLILCRLAGASVKEAEVEEPPLDVDA